MSSTDPSTAWVVRLLRVGAAALAGAALVVWVTPVNAAGRNLMPVGCGSPASPRLDKLTDFVCSDFISGAKVLSLSLAVGAAVLVLIADAVLPRLGRHGWALGAALAGVVAVPVMAVAVGSLFTTVAGSGADGTLLRCGTPMFPATDRISSALCGQATDRRKALDLGAVALAALVVVGGGYVSSARAAGRTDAGDASASEANATPDPSPGLAEGATEQSTTGHRPAPHDPASPDEENRT